MTEDYKYPIDNFVKGRYLIPDIALIKSRLIDIYAQPIDDSSAYPVARNINDFIQNSIQFSGQIWLADSLETALVDEVGREFISQINDDLSGEMATTNAIFDELILEDGVASLDSRHISFELSGMYHGEQDRERPFSGSDMRVSISGKADRVATNICFGRFEIEADGNIIDF